MFPTLFGNTPARAGRTPTGLWPARASTEHPRAGGEDKLWALAVIALNGTPPRGRGRRLVGGRVEGDRRNTPARAGKTAAAAAARSRRSEHPRAGGEDTS